MFWLTSQVNHINMKPLAYCYTSLNLNIFIDKMVIDRVPTAQEYWTIRVYMCSALHVLCPDTKHIMTGPVFA